MIEESARHEMRCVLCESQHVKRLHVSKKGQVFRCRDCGIAFFRSQVVTDTLYDSTYFQENYATIKDTQQEKAAAYVAYIRQFQKSGSLLDYGCGSGVFLAAGVAAGFTQNAGVDISDAALELALRNAGPQVRFINSSRDEIGEQQFDIVSFVDSAAHIPHFSAVFTSLTEHHLKPSGVLFIRTPNISRRYLAYVRCLSFVLPAEHIDELYFIPKRYLLFNCRALRQFLERKHFTILDMTTEGDYHRILPATSFKARLRNLLFRRIPKWLNPQNSIVTIARSSQGD